MSRVTLPTTRFTYAEYDRMVGAGVFGDTRVELLNGRIYRMRAQRGPHMSAVSAISEAFQKARLPTDWVVIQGTLRLDPFSAPDPDLMWLPVPRNTPEHLWPLPLVVVEVSDTTYKRDSGAKLRKYAQARIQDYWIANLPEDRLEVYRDPRNPTGRLSDCHYGSVTQFRRGQAVSLAQRAGVTLAVSELLP